MSTKPGGMVGGIKPTLIGLFSGGLFALSAIGFRGAILDLHLPNFVMAATFTLVVGLLMQAVVLSLYLLLRQRRSMTAIGQSWKRSLFAGLMGARPRSSGFWPSRSPAASVRRWRWSKCCLRSLSRVRLAPEDDTREAVGMAFVVAGVVLLIFSEPPTVARTALDRVNRARLSGKIRTWKFLTSRYGSAPPSA